MATFHGTADGELIQANDGDIVYGEDGADTLVGANSGIFGADLHGGKGDDSLLGSARNDTLLGGGGHDTLSGGAGDDRFFWIDRGADDGSPYDNLIDGGAGSDTFDFSRGYNPAMFASTWLNIDLSTGRASTMFPLGHQIVVGVGLDTISGIENVIGSQSGDNIAGSATGNWLEGQGGYDNIRGHEGNDTIYGGGGPLGGGINTPVDGENSLGGDAGDDLIFGSSGKDTVMGGTGADTLSDEGGSNYIRGEDGDDSLWGGSDFDDVHGNTGHDTEHGNGGDDWVVGGQGNDVLFGDAGGDIVYGNLGVDTLSGGDGFDWVRGGQGDDSLHGGDGGDWLWGDRGDDTVTGGYGADVFHIFTGGGLDQVTDFHYEEGDRVIVDYGTYTVSQVGADTVVDLGGGDRMVLVGVMASSLPVGWISTL